MSHEAVPFGFYGSGYSPPQGVPVIPPLDSRGRLPLGRHVTDMFEVYDRFGSGRPRYEMFEELAGLVDLVTGSVRGIGPIWLGGSFVSSEQTPGDVDVVFLARSTLLDEAVRAGGVSAAMVARLVNRKFPEFRTVSAFLLPVPPPYVGDMHDASRDVVEALSFRGYWDQLWQCGRDENEQPVPNDHGYLEVRIDD